MAYYRHQVTPFGNLRIKACLRLPEAYRSLSRPSSPVSTKAFTVCPLKLDSNFEISHAACGCSRESSFATLCRPLRTNLPPGGFNAPDFAVKITFVFGIRIYFQDRARMARLSLHYLLQSEKNISPCGCQRADDCLFSRSKASRLGPWSDLADLSDLSDLCVRRVFF